MPGRQMFLQKWMAKKEVRSLASLIFSCYAPLSTVRHMKILIFYNICHMYDCVYSENMLNR